MEDREQAGFPGSVWLSRAWALTQHPSTEGLWGVCHGSAQRNTAPLGRSWLICEHWQTPSASDLLWGVSSDRQPLPTACSGALWTVLWALAPWFPAQAVLPKFEHATVCIFRILFFLQHFYKLFFILCPNSHLTSGLTNLPSHLPPALISSLTQCWCL